jgi:hypothetical protein
MRLSIHPSNLSCMVLEERCRFNAFVHHCRRSGAPNRIEGDTSLWRLRSSTRRWGRSRSRAARIMLALPMENVRTIRFYLLSLLLRK